MKIGEVLVGQEYGAVDEPGRSFSRVIPRQVSVQEIVTVPETVYRWASGNSTRNVRRVKIKMLDDKSSSGRYWDTIAIAAKGSIITIEARKLVALWSELEPGIKARAVSEQKRAAKEAEVKNRLKKLGFKTLDYGEVHVTVRDGGSRVEVEFNDKHVEKLLKMLESSVEMPLGPLGEQVRDHVARAS